MYKGTECSILYPDIVCFLFARLSAQVMTCDKWSTRLSNGYIYCNSECRITTICLIMGLKADFKYNIILLRSVTKQLF